MILKIVPYSITRDSGASTQIPVEGIPAVVQGLTTKNLKATSRIEPDGSASETWIGRLSVSTRFTEDDTPRKRGDILCCIHYTSSTSTLEYQEDPDKPDARQDCMFATLTVRSVLGIITNFTQVMMLASRLQRTSKIIN